jgi:hypothetical protein
MVVVAAPAEMTGAAWRSSLILRLKVVQFFAIVLPALALVPSGAHLFALSIRVPPTRW